MVLGIALADRPAVLAGRSDLGRPSIYYWGLLAELQTRTESQDKPIYEIRHTYGGRES